MDVYYPEKPNGYAVVHATGTGWHDQLGYDAIPPKASDQVAISGKPLVEAGYTLFALNHREAPRFVTRARWRTSNGRYASSVIIQSDFIFAPTVSVAWAALQAVT